MVLLSGVPPLCSFCWVWEMISFSTYCGHIFHSFFSVSLLLVFGGQNVCMGKCFESSVPVLTLELQEIILWLLIDKSESYMFSAASLRQLTRVVLLRLCRSFLFVVIFMFSWQLSILSFPYVCFERGWVIQP